MATSQDDKLINLIKCFQEFKKSMEFRNYDSNANKVKLYKSVRKSQDLCLTNGKEEIFGITIDNKLF